MSDSERPYTLRRLFNDLAELISSGVPGDMPVIVEGCDCYGDGNGVAVDNSHVRGTADKCVVIKRKD